MKCTRDEITPEIIREILDCNYDTGELFWRWRPRSFFNSDRDHQWWNQRFSGKQALTTVTERGYFRGTIFGHDFRAHRVVWAHYHGDWPGDQIDHIAGLLAGNRIDNLRDVTQFENAKNVKRHSRNTSGVTGVSWCNRNQKWFARISCNGSRKSLGYFSKFADAVAARKAAEIEHGYHPNHGRAA